MLDRFIASDTTLTESFYIDNIKNKNVLVIGAGPSTTQVNWENLDIDTILTTSFFYLNDKIRSLTNIKHITLTQLVNLSDPRLIEFLDKNQKCLIGFEVNSNPFYNSKAYKNFVEKYKNRVVNYWTTHHTTALMIGVGGRLCFFTINYLPKNLYFVGIDGTSKTPEKDPINSFRPKSMHKGYDRLNHEQTPGILKMNEILFNYSQQNNIKIYNLGEGFNYNISTPYSKKYYPLPSHIKNQIQ